MAKRILILGLVIATFAALAPAAVVVGGFGGGVVVRPAAHVSVGVYAGSPYYYGYYGPRYYAPQPVYVEPYYYGYRSYGYYGPRYYGGYYSYRPHRYYYYDRWGYRRWR